MATTKPANPASRTWPTQTFNKAAKGQAKVTALESDVCPPHWYLIAPTGQVGTCRKCGVHKQFGSSKRAMKFGDLAIIPRMGKY